MKGVKPSSAGVQRSAGGVHVDVHTHLAPVMPDDASLGVAHADDGRVTVDGSPLGPPALMRPEALIAALDGSGVDVALVSVPPPFFRQDLGVGLAGRWTRAVNTGLLEASGHDRLRPLAYLPFEHPRLAREEIARLREDPRWAGWSASAGGRSTSLASDELAAVWDALVLDGRPLMLHPGTSPDPRLDELYLSNLLGNPVETAVAAAQLVLGDVLASRPALRVLLVHCGGCVPDIVPRWDRGVETARPGLRPLTEPPSVAVRRFYVDCLVHDPGAVDRAVEVFGADKVVLGSDWPFPMGFDDPKALIAHRGEAFVEQAASANAAALLGRS